MVTVFTKPGCPACVGTMRYLERHEVPYEAIDVTQNLEARDFVVRQLGYTSLPVVVTDTSEAWSGLRIDKLADLAATRDIRH